jgi:hypothetical protein
MQHTAHIAPLDLTPTGHLPAIVAAVARQHPEQQPAACTVWPGLCVERGDHTDHSNHDLISHETGWPVSVGFVGLDDGTPLIYVDSGVSADCSPDEVDAVAAQLRAAATALERMRDQVVRIQAQRG